MNRRHFLALSSAASAFAAGGSSSMHIATNTYPWGTFANGTARPSNRTPMRH